MARLLLVDDDIAEISAVKRALARLAHAPILATNASDALASITQRRPDLLIVGATCENGGALALALRLEEDEATRAIPLLVLGAGGDLPPHAVQLPRPVDPGALAEQVKAIVGDGRAPAPPKPARPATGPGRAATPALDLEAPPHARPVPAPPAAPVARPVPLPAPPADSAPRTALERRGPPITLPQPLERRAEPSDPANARRAAVEALRARAEELRRTPEPPATAAAEAAAGLDALFELAPPAGVDAASIALTPAPTSGTPTAVVVPPVPPPQTEPAPFDGAAFQAPDAAPPIAETPFDLPQESNDLLVPAGLEPAEPEPAALEPAHPERPAPSPAPSGLEGLFDAIEVPEPSESTLAAPLAAPWPPPPTSRPRSLVEEAEERAAAEAALRAESEAARARELEAAAAARAAELKAAVESASQAARRAAEEAEARARAEAAARAEAGTRAQEAATRAKRAEAAARKEVEARKHLEAELARLRQQLESDRRSHAAELAAVERRAEAGQRDREAELSAAAEGARQAALRAAEEAAARAAEAEAARRRAEEEAVRRAEEEAVRRAEAEAAMHRTADQAADRAKAELETARRQAEQEAARRAEVEVALRQATEQAARLAAERDALEREKVRAAAEPATPPAAAPVRLADVPPPDETQEAARRRALSLRPRRESEAAPASGQPPTPFEEPPAPEPEPDLPPPAEPPAELRAGNLEDLPAPRLLARSARARLGGRLDVTGEAERSLWFEDGRVVGATSSASGERVEEVAFRLGLLTREQLRQVAGTAAALPARRAAMLLVERGYLKPAELTGLARRRTDEVVFGVFAESGARFRWAPEPVPPEERIAPDRQPLALAVEGVRRRWLAPRAEAVLGGPAALLAPAPGGPTPAELGLGPEERRALALADGLRTVDELLAASPLDPLSSRQLFAAAILIGVLSVRVVQAGRPSAQVSNAIDLARVKEKLEQVRRADYFSILGLGRICTPHEVREAAERLLAEFDARRFEGLREEGLPARLAEIRSVVGDAREVLADDALRAEYLKGLGE